MPAEQPALAEGALPPAPTEARAASAPSHPVTVQSRTAVPREVGGATSPPRSRSGPESPSCPENAPPAAVGVPGRLPHATWRRRRNRSGARRGAGANAAQCSTEGPAGPETEGSTPRGSAARPRPRLVRPSRGNRDGKGKEAEGVAQAPPTMVARLAEPARAERRGHEQSGWPTSLGTVTAVGVGRAEWRRRRAAGARSRRKSRVATGLLRRPLWAPTPRGAGPCPADRPRA